MYDIMHMQIIPYNKLFISFINNSSRCCFLLVISTRGGVNPSWIWITAEIRIPWCWRCSLMMLEMQRTSSRNLRCDERRLPQSPQYRWPGFDQNAHFNFKYYSQDYHLFFTKLTISEMIRTTLQITPIFNFLTKTQKFN